MGFEIPNSPWTAPAGPVRATYDQIWRPCGIFVDFGCINSVTFSQGCRTAPLRVPHGPRTGSIGNEKHWRFPCGARTGIVRDTRGVLRIIRPNHKCTAVSSCTGPVAWCDHENSIDVKILRALHSALRAKNPTGDKNLTGPVVGCDWGIRNWYVCLKLLI